MGINTRLGMWVVIGGEWTTEAFLTIPGGGGVPVHHSTLLVFESPPSPRKAVPMVVVFLLDSTGCQFHAIPDAKIWCPTMASMVGGHLSRREQISCRPGKELTQRRQGSMQHTMHMSTVSFNSSTGGFLVSFCSFFKWCSRGPQSGKDINGIGGGGVACRRGVLFSSAAGGAYWPIAIRCPSLGPVP